MTKAIRSFVVVVAAIAMCIGTVVAQAPPPHTLSIAYFVSAPTPATHLYEVTMRIGGVARTTRSLEVKMPVWTPGSYLVREYERNVQDFEARSATGPLPSEKTDKNTWRVTLGDPAPDSVEISYRVYANELTVRTSHLDDTHAYFNGATMFMYVDGAKDVPVRLTVTTPVDWKIATGLEAVPGPAPTTGTHATWTFSAPDFDHLVDSPVEAGAITILRFEALGKPHEIAIWGSGNYDPARLATDFKKIVEASARTVDRGLPYDRYVFILHVYPGGAGGLEHLNSTTFEASPFVFRKKDSYRDFLGLVAHEYFHLWLVKRIRPAALGPFDYDAENYTKMLWFMEGGTDYYALVNLMRAGLITEDEYDKELAKTIQAHERTPGRKRMGLESSSFDAWIKYYRPNENSVNSQISYYTKGAVVAAMLDLEIRGRTGGKASLDDVLRTLWDEYAAKGAGVPEEALEPAVERVVGSSVREFFDRYVRGTDEIPYDRFLAFANRRLVAEVPKDETRLDPASAGAWLGATVTDTAGRPIVTTVLEGSPAWNAGVNTGDELLAIDGARVSATSLGDRLLDRAPGDTMTLTLFRRDTLRTIPVTLAARLPETYKIEKITKEPEKKSGSPK